MINIEPKFMVSGLTNQYKILIETVDNYYKNHDSELILNQLDQIDISVQKIKEQIISDLEAEENDYLNYGLNQKEELQ